MRKVWLGLLILFTLAVLGNGALYLLAYAGHIDLAKKAPPPGPLSELVAHFHAKVAARDWVFLAHVLGGMLALALGPFQFWTALRRRQPRLHRTLGYGYFMGILVGGLGGLLSAPVAWGGAPTQVGFSLLALVWLASSGRGLQLILQRRVEEHRSWMLLSYGLTLAAISLRIQLPLLLATGLSGQAIYGTVAWSCWTPQLAWWLVRTRNGSRLFQANPE